MNNTTTQKALPEMYGFVGVEYFDKINEDSWKLWLSKGLWDYRDAIRLLMCEHAPCKCITECTKDFESGFRNPEFYPDDLYACFYEKINNTTSEIYKSFELYKSEAWSYYGFSDDKYPKRIPPETFIKWALSKSILIVPQEMQDWYSLNQSQENTSPESYVVISTDEDKYKKSLSPASEPTYSQDAEIANWGDILPKLKGVKKRAAQLAIMKLQKKTHIEAHDELFPEKVSVETDIKKNYVFRKKATAEELAQEYGLNMPPWNSTE